MNSTIEKISKLITENSPMRSTLYNIDDDVDLIYDLDFDVMSLANLFEALEKEFSFEFIKTNKIFSPFLNVKEFNDFVIENMNSQSATLNRSDKELEDFVKNVNYYNDSKKRELEDFKVISRHSLSQNSEVSFLSQDYLIQYKKGALTAKKSLGSTGTYITCLSSLIDEVIDELFIRRKRLLWYKIKGNDKFLQFHSSIYIGNRIVENQDAISTKNYLSLDRFIVRRKGLERYINELFEFDPIWIIGEPSTLYILSQFIVNNCDRSMDEIKYIELKGEQASSELQEILTKAFPNAIVANKYYIKELGAICLECPHNNLQLISNSKYIEIIDDGEKVEDGENGNIIVTNFINSAMPLIRYDTGDKGFLYKSNCSCNDRVLNLTTVMNNELLRLDEGDLCSCKVLEYPIELINFEFNNPIEKFQVVQNDINLFDVYIKLKMEFWNWQTSIRESLEKAYKSRIGMNTDWNVIFVKEMDSCEYTGNLTYFKSNF